jgi:hypothetical protein
MHTNRTSCFRNNLLLILLALFPACRAASQEFTPTYKLAGEVRLRSELDGRDFDNSTAPNTYTLSRVRFGVDAIPAENIHVFIQAEDSRVFGTESDATGFSTLADSKNLDLHQGYIDINQFILRELMVRLGRQELAYGNERLVGRGGWHNVGRSFDGALFRLTFENLALDAFAMNTGEVQSNPPVATPAAVAYVRDAGQDFFGLNSTLKSLKDHSMDFYLFYQWNRHQSVANEDDLRRFTLGSYQKGTFDPIDYEAALAFQGGTTRGTDISAFLLSANLGYGFESSPLSRVALGCDYLSGTPAGNSRYESFDPMYHTGHRFYGFMDYFINIPANTNNRGLVDLYARAAFKLTDQVDGGLWLHQMTLAQDLNGDNGLGQEIDATGRYRYDKAVNFEIGLSAFIPAAAMRQNFGHPDVAYWGYLTTAVSF